jgi:hypothetical protein
VHFACHYLEMVAVMVLGMVVLGPPLDAGLGLLGAQPDTWRDTTPELSLLTMAVTMTVPMAAWMRVRGHGWRSTLEMSAAMLVPTAAAVAVLAVDATDAVEAVFALEHTAMFVAMLGVMLRRREEYGWRRHGARPVVHRPGRRGSSGGAV